VAGELASVAGGRVVEETFDGGQDAPLDRRVKALEVAPGAGRELDAPLSSVTEARA
jgi:hypothetical protein